jgi:uncharacterized RDD family membrane protein YckC
MEQLSRSYASPRARLLAFARDYLAIALYLIMVVIFGLTLRSAFPKTASKLFGNPLTGQVTAFVLVTLPVTLYFTLLESSSWQATWGKRQQRLKVIGRDGRRLSRSRALVRNLLKFVPWELTHTCMWQVGSGAAEPSPLITAGFVLVWLLVIANVACLWLGSTHQTLYDWLAATYVVTCEAPTEKRAEHELDGAVLQRRADQARTDSSNP